MPVQGELLGRAVLELTVDPKPMDAGLAAAEKRAGASADRMGSTVGRKLGSVGKSMESTGKSMSRTFTVPILAAMAATGKLAVDFEQKMELIHTQAGASQREVEALKGQVLDLAKHSAQGPNQLADALFRLEGAGLRGAKAMGALQAASQLAAVGNANVEDTAKTLSQVWFTNIKGAGSFNNTVALLNATVGSGDLRLQQLVDALGTGVLGASKLAGLSLRDVTAVLAVFGDETNNVSGWAAQFATSLHFLTNPTTKARGALQDLGLQSLTLSADLNKPHGISIALQTLKDRLDALPGGIHGTKGKELLGDIFPGGRGRVLEILLNQLDRLDAKYKQQAGTTKAWGDAVTKTHQTAAYQIKNLTASMEASAIKVGDDILPEVLKVGKEVAGEVEKVAGAFSSLPKGAQDAIIKGGLVLAALGPGLTILGKFTSGIGRLYSLATLLGRLSSGKQSLFGGGAAGKATSTVVSMEVGTLIAKSMVGGSVGVGGGAGGSSWKMAGTSTPLPPGATARRADGSYVIGGKAAASEAGAGAAVVGKAEAAGMGMTVAGTLSKTIGYAGLALMAAPLGIALGKVVSNWIHNDALSEGREWADKFLGPLPDAVKKKFRDPLAEARKQALDQPLKTLADRVSPGAARGRIPAGILAPISTADAAKARKQAFNEGWQVGQATVAGLKGVKDPTPGILLGDFLMQLKKLPGQAQPEAAKTMLFFAQGLVNQGKMPQRALAQIMKGLERQIPGFAYYLQQQGLTADRGFAKTLKFNDATRTLKSTLLGYRNQFGDWQVGSNLTGQNILKNLGTAMDDLHTKVKNSSGQTRKDALKEWRILHDQGTNLFQSLGGKVEAAQASMAGSIQSGSRKSALSAATNFQNYEQNVWAGINSGVISATQGADLLDKALNATLKAFGAQPIPLTLTVGKLPLPKGAFKTGGASPRGVVAAQGALMQIGRPGEAGHDTVPMNIGGQSIVAGGGEVAAIFTRHQYAEANQGLAHRGGLPGIFRNRRPNYMASGGFVADPGTNFTVGQEPQIASRLGALANALGVTIYGISGYRSPAHSIAVGGFGDDPHTRGQAADIGVNSQLRSSAAQISRAQLAKFGLDRPFDESDDPGNSEVNHIQLLGSAVGKVIAGAVSGALGPAAAKAAVQQIHAPKVRGKGAIASMVRAALGKATSAANAYAGSHAGSGGGSLGNLLSGFSGGGSESANQALGRRMMLAAGWPASEWPSLQALWNQESGWNANAVNSSSGAYGIPQALGHGHPFALGDAAAQIAWGLNYIKGRYGSPSAAEAHERANNWYAQGGLIPGFAQGGFAGLVKTLPPGTGHAYDVMTSGSVDSAGNSGGFNAAGANSIFGRIPVGPNAGPWWAEGDRGTKSAGNVHGSGVGKSFGGKPGGQAARFTFRGKSTIGVKVDTGDGNSFGDLYPPLDAAIGFDKVGKGGPVLVEFLSNAHARKLLSAPEALSLAKAKAKAAVPKPPKPKGRNSGFTWPGGTLGQNGPLPFDTGDLGALNQALGTIYGLDGGDSSGVGGGSKGAVQKLWDLISWNTGTLWPAGPAPNFSSIGSPADFVISQDAAGNPVAPYISPNINTVVKQLAQAISWQSEGVGDLQGTLRLSRGVAAAVRRAIKRRQDMIAAIRKRIQENLRRMNQLKARIAAENKKKKPDRKKIGAWNSQWAQLEADNLALSGSKNSIGSGGELKTIQDQLGTTGAASPLATAEGGGSSPTGLYALQGTVSGWIDSLGGTGGEIPQQALTLKGWQQNLWDLKPGADVALWNAVAGAASSAPTSPATDGTLLSLLEQWKTSKDLTAAVGQLQGTVLDQSQALRSLPPFGGSFLWGGVVPGAPGEPRTVIAHGGERITPAGGQGGDTHLHLHFKPGTEWLRDFVHVEVERGTRNIARQAGRPMPGRGGGLLPV